MYNNPYINGFTQQQTLDRVNEQIRQLEGIRNQMQQPIQQPTNLTQNFQLAPTNRDVIKYASSIDEVNREMVIGDTPYFSKDMSVVWIKNTKGEIKSYELNEIIPKDEKDMQIELLQAQLNELKGRINNEPIVTNDIQPKNATDTTRDDEQDGTAIKESKPTSISRVPTSKKKQ